MFDPDPRHLQWAREIGRISLHYGSARVIQVAVKSGVFDTLSQSPGLTTADLARQLQLDPITLEKLLIACCALDCLQRTGDGWTPTEKARIALDPASPLYQGNIIRHTCGVWQTWNDLEHRLQGRTGASVFTDDAEREWDHRSFILGMRDLAAAGRAQELAERIDLSGRELLIDIGGGPATYSIALCHCYRQLRVELFDQPQTLALAAPLIEEAGLGDRITLVEGDWNDDPFGQNADAVLMSQVLHGPEDHTEMKLAKAHEALKPCGLLIVQDFMLNAEKTGPLWPALFNLMVGAWSVPEMTDRITAAGFAIQQTQTLPDENTATLITAIKK